MISKNHIKYIQSLHSKKNRADEGLFIIEGVKLVTEFINQRKFIVKEIFATGDFTDYEKFAVSAQDIKFTVISEDELKKISLQTSPNKILAIVEQVQHSLNAELLTTSNTLFLDDIRDPGNLGTIIRIADWFGIDQVICSPNCTELYNPKTLQASMGAVLRVNVPYIAFTELLPQLESISIYGAVLEGANIYKTELKKGLIVIGNEANGISQEILKYITNGITIPAAYANGSESLNAANACAVICSEFHRQLTYR